MPFLFATLPLVARFGQSIRRWWDSGLITHLINVRLLLLGVGPLELDHFFPQAGKYFTGIVYYFCYYLWRHNGEQFPIRSSLSSGLTRLKVLLMARASSFSVSWEQFTQYMLHHGQVQRVLY